MGLYIPLLLEIRVVGLLFLDAELLRLADRGDDDLGLDEHGSAVLIAEPELLVLAVVLDLDV